MTHRQLKAGYLTLAWLNTIASSYYFNYLFFYLHKRFGFGDRENLWVSALHGFIYMFAAWQCGKFAERRGYVLSLKLGFAGLTVAMVVGAFLNSAFALMLLLAGYSVVLLLTWPALEALVSERESRAGTQRMVGIYNCTWAGAGALAYFTGGKLYDALGHAVIFWVPAGLFGLQFLFTLWLEKHHAAARPSDTLSSSEGERGGVRGRLGTNPVHEGTGERGPLTPALSPSEGEREISHRTDFDSCGNSDEPAHFPEAAAFKQPVSPQAFLKMAWFANPFAYIAINTLLAVMPGVAQKLLLSPTRVGLFCSVWFFARVAAFALLWKWKGWHYRFRWLVGSFVVLIGSFAVVLLARELWIVILAQVFFGLATGLIYYSSLFYSMDVGETKGEHGGLHEAFIGLGIFVGPSVGATALYLAPQNPNAGTWAVSALLVCGLAGLVGIRMKASTSKLQAPEKPQ